MSYKFCRIRPLIRLAFAAALTLAWGSYFLINTNTDLLPDCLSEFSFMHHLSTRCPSYSDFLERSLFLSGQGIISAGCRVKMSVPPAQACLSRSATSARPANVSVRKGFAQTVEYMQGWARRTHTNSGKESDAKRKAAAVTLGIRLPPISTLYRRVIISAFI